MLGFKPQPLNYSAQAESALRKLASLGAANGNLVQQEVRIMIWLADQIRDSVHFSMPDDGRIFDDHFKGIQGSEIHLPFPRITLEYRATQDPGISVTGEPLLKASRRVLLAIELSAKELVYLTESLFIKGAPREYTDRFLTAFPDGLILVTGAFFIEYETPLWAPPYAAWLFPTKGWDQFGETNVIASLRAGEHTDKLGMSGRPFPIFWRAWLEMEERLGGDMTQRYIANDIGVEAFVVLELIEALSCSNVRVGTLQSVKPNVNARRVRDGKLPLYETKVLVVDVSAKKPGKARGPLEETRASPGEHLRRGHIQSYNTKQGKVNLWKQSITVSAGNPRAIKKTYKVKKSSSP